MIRNAHIWQGGGFSRGDLAIDGQTIEVVGRIPTDYPADTVIEGEGRYLLPGVIDCHAHSTMICGRGHMRDFFASNENELTIDAVVNAERMARHGITTIRDCGGKRYETLAVRDRIMRGQIIGPRMLCSGTPIKAIGGHEPGTDITGPDQARAKVREFLREGVDFIKVMLTGGLGKAGEDPGCVELTQEELDAIVSEARRHGRRVACHCHSREGMEMIVRAGADSVEHATYLDPEINAKLIDAGVFVVPTFEPYMNYALMGEREGQLMDTVLAARAIIGEKKRRFAQALGQGVQIAFGRDSGGFMMDQGDFTREMGFLEDAGMPRAEIINCATAGAARLCGLDGVTGRLAEGLSADIIMLDRDPLCGLEAFRRDLRGVWVRGRFLHPEPSEENCE